MMLLFVILVFVAITAKPTKDSRGQLQAAAFSIHTNLNFRRPVSTNPHAVFLAAAAGATRPAAAVFQDDIPRRDHCVKGIDCVEVTISSLPRIGQVTILEATASAQNILVDLALGDDATQTGGSMQEEEAALTLPTGDPYGAVLWPAASVVAHALLPLLEKNTTVLELGTGTGLVSLAAYRAGAKHVIATDYEQLPLDLLQYAAKLSVNHQRDSIQNTLSCELLDICDSNQPLYPTADFVVAADIMYEPTTGSAMAHRVLEALQNNATVLVGDSPGRAGRPAFLRELRTLLDEPALDFINVTGWTVQGPRHALICGPESKTVTRTMPTELTIALLILNPNDFLPALDKFRNKR